MGPPDTYNRKCPPGALRRTGGELRDQATTGARACWAVGASHDKLIDVPILVVLQPGFSKT